MTNKKVLILVSFLMFAFLSFVGCSIFSGKGQDKIKIEIRGETEITLYTTPENEDQKDTITFVVSVSGVDEETSKEITYTVENKDCIDVSVGTPDRDGDTEVTVTAKKGGTTTVNIMSVYGNKSATVVVHVVEKLVKMAVYPNYKQTVYTNSVNVLEPSSIISFEPTTTSQKDVMFELCEEYPEINIEKSNGISVLSVGECGTQTIRIKATAVDGDTVIEGITPVEFTINVIEKLSIETVEITNTTLEEVVAFSNGVFETIELTSNAMINSAMRTNNLQIKVNPKNVTSARFVITEENYYSLNRDIADVTRVGDENSFSYDVVGISFGDTALKFTITIDGFEGYSYEMTIPVHVVELPSVVTVNGNNEDFTGTLFTVYDTWGMKFEVTVGTSNSYDFRYEVRCDPSVVTLYNSLGNVISLMDIEGDVLRKTNPMNGKEVSTIYAVAKNEAADRNVSSTLSFIAYATADNPDAIVQTNFNFTVSQGVRAIRLEDFEKNTIYVEKGGKAKLNYTLEPVLAAESGNQVIYDESYISYKIMTNGGEQYISVEKSEENGQFIINGLENTDKVSVCVVSANGVSSDPISIRVYTPGTFVAVNLPSASTNNNILVTNYTGIRYGFNGVYMIDSLSEPFRNISYSEEEITAVLGDGESVDAPLFGAVIATNTTSKFSIVSDPSNEDQTIISTSYKFVVPEVDENDDRLVRFRDFDVTVDALKGTITGGGYIQTTKEGTIYVLIETKFLTGGEGNGTVKTKSYYRIVAINSYPKITSLTLRSLSEDVVYNKQGLGDIDIMGTDYKTYNFTRLTIGPEAALNREILRKETTNLKWTLTGVPDGIEINYVLASNYYEFNPEMSDRIADLEGITVVFEDDQGAYGYSDSEEMIYTRAYVFFNFDDSYFGTRNSMIFTLSTQLTQFSSNYVKSVLVTVKRPVVATSLDIGYVATNVSNDYKRLMTQVNTYSYELYIDSRDGLNVYDDIKNLTVRNRNLTNSFAITATLHPSNITNGKLRYIVCDADGNEVTEDQKIKVLEDGTIIPLSSGVAYVKLVPMSGELVNNHIIIVRVADGESWDTAYKIYNQADLLAIEGTEETRDYLKKYYELANDIYMNKSITPIGVFDDEVIAFSGGLRGYNEYTGEVYKIYNLDLKSKTATIGDTTYTYVGLFGRVTGEIKEIGLEVASCSVTLINSGDAYVGMLAGRTSTTAELGGILVQIEECNVFTIQSLYFGGVIGYNEAKIIDTPKTISVTDDMTKVIINRTRVSGAISIETESSAKLCVGGIVGYNAGEITSDFDYFGSEENFNNANDNIDCIINLESRALTKIGNIGGVVGENAGKVSKISSVATVVANIENAGGIAGLNRGTLTECYFAGQVRGADNVGGIAGKVDVLESSTSCSEAVMTMCITEILDTTVSKTTVITQSRIQGVKNVGGLVGYIEFSVPSQNHIYTTGYHTIEYCYVRSYLSSDAYSDIALTSETGNLGGLVGYAKNTNISKSYAIVNLNIAKMVTNLNIGGLVGKLQNVVFNARKINGSVSFGDNVRVQDSFVVGSIIIEDSEDLTDYSIGQLIGILDLGSTPVMQEGVVERVYTNVSTIAQYNPMFQLGIVGGIRNSYNLPNKIFTDSYYIYNGSSSYAAGRAVTLLDLQDSARTFGAWSTYRTVWNVVQGSNDDIILIHKFVDVELRPLYTIVPVIIDLNIREYTAEDGDQLYTRIDSYSTVTETGASDPVSKSAVLYIYEGEENEYSIKDIVNIQTVPNKLNNARYYVVSDNESIVKVVGDKIYPVGEGTAIITVCSAYNKEEVYDCIQLAVVYHNFNMRFLDGDLNEYSDEDVIRISKSGSEQIIVYTDDNSAVNGVKVIGDIMSSDETAITVNEKVLGSDILFNTSSGAIYSNLLSVKENGYYTETTYIDLYTIPYFNVSLYTNPKSPTAETLGQKTIYNNEDGKPIKLLIYVGATEISFNTNDVKSSIGSEISVIVTLRTDYQEDTLLMFIDDELVLSDNSNNTKIDSGEWTVTYYANSKNIATYYDTFQQREVFSGYITYEFKINASDKYLNTYDNNNLKVLYETIKASITFAGKSSYLSARTSANIEDYPVKNTFNFKITPAIVSSINIQNYSAGRTVSGKYDPSEDPSTSIVPGEIGLVDILITPMYAGITKLTLENAYMNYTKISLLQVLQEEETGLYVQSNEVIKNTDNGIELALKSSIDSQGNKKFDGHIYARTLIASEIPFNVELTLIVTATFEEDGKETTKVQSITLTTTETAGLYMSFEGANYSYIVKGSTVQPLTKVLGFTNPVVYKLATIEPTYENFVHYFDASLTSMVPRNSITEDEIEILFNDQIRVDSTTGEIYVGVLIKQGSVLTIEGSVTEYMNNGIKIGSASVDVYVLDYIIKGIKVQNTVNSTLTTICNIPKSLKLDFIVDRCKVEDYEYEYLGEVLDDGLYRNVASAVEAYFGIKNGYVSDIDVQLNELLREINTYETGVWYYTSSVEDASVKNYQSISIGESYDSLFEVQTAYYESGSSDLCFALRLKEIATLRMRASITLTFTFDTKTNSASYTFNPNNIKDITGDNMDFDVEFNVQSANSSSEDNPLPIYDKDKFLEYVFETEDVHYILLTDITLDNWTAQNTSVASLDGNGYTITINSFAPGEGDSAYFGLFKTISSKTIITNLNVKFADNIEIKVMSGVTETHIGLFAGENEGTLFNCAVITDGETNIDVKEETDIVNAGLFVNTNKATGAISNCRVGKIEGLGNTDDVIHFASYKDISGFVMTNEGHIASCFAKDISLTCKELSAYDIDETGVAGFVGTNKSSGKIYYSYVEGIRGKDNKNSQIQLSEQGYKKYNTGIYSPGRIAGYVYKNSGYIQDAYTNIPLISPTSSTGFVYSNTATGVIQNSFSVCLQPTTLDGNQEEYPNTSRSQFTGLDDLNQVLNEGEISYAYYYNAEYDSNIYTGLGEPALALPASSFQDSMDEFGNFIYGENMIWEASSLHPVLVSPNRIIKRQRYLVNNLSGNEEDVNLEEYVYYYEDKIDGEYDYYGSYTNPIVISNGIQFVQMSATERLTPYTDTSSEINETIYTSLNQNDYIVIKNIDLSSVIDLGLESLQSITYAGMFEGNGFTFDNVSILSEKSSHLSGVSFGMFEQIGALVLFENDVLVTVDVTDYHAQFKNLTIKINAISGTHATAVGTLAGVIVNADVINVNLISNSTEKVTVQGERYVGALAGYVAGDSVINNITSDISVSADFRNSSSDISKIKPYTMGNIALNNSIFAYEFSIDTQEYTGGYAGGIIGLADCFTLKITKSADMTYASISRYDFDKTGYNYIAINFAPQILSITVKDNVSIMGDIAGGLVGINCQGTSIYNGRFMLTLGEEQKISGGIIAGGLIGQNYGKIDQSAITHDDETQLQIDEEDITYDQINQTLFYESNKEPIYVGGLVGYNNGVGSNSGIVTNCYSRAEVISTNAYNVGGMVGYMASGYLQYCYVTGNVVCRQQTEDPDTGNIIGSDGRAAGSVAYLASFISKNSIKYFTEYTGLAYYTMWGLVCANNWDNDVNINTTGALIGFASSNVRLTEGVINGDMDIFVNNMDNRLYDALFLYSVNGPYNIVKIADNGTIGTIRLIESFTVKQFKSYAEEDANPSANKLYQTWDTTIWDLTAPYFPLLRLNTSGNQTYITNEDELRAIGTKGYYIVQNDIYLTKDWIPVDGFEGTLTSKKKKDGTYCTIYNVNINGECYGKLNDDGDDDVENMGNIGFFSSIKDKAYIYNLNFVIGGNVMLADNYDELADGTPIHEQRTEWENFEGKTGYTLESGKQGEITYEEAFINGISNYLDYIQIIRNNAADLAAGLFVNSYGTGALAGVATNATISNITISYAEYTTYTGHTAVTTRASINANTPFIGGFIGYAQNTKLTNCQITQNPVKLYVKNSSNEPVMIESAATINVYNNEYIYNLTSDSMKFANFQNPLEIAKIILEFYQQPQCVGGFIGKLDAKSSYIKFNGRNVEAHINIYERYANKDRYNLPALNLNVGGLLGYSNVASLDTVNVYATIVSAVNNVGVDVSDISGLDEALNKTELNIGGVIGVSDKSIYNYCSFAGTIKIIDASQSFTQPSVKSVSTVNVGGVIGKIQSDVTTNYCVARGNSNFSEVSGYSDYKDPIVIQGKDRINYLNVGGTIGNAITVSPKIKKSLFTGLISLGGNVDNICVGGVLGSMNSSNILTNQATIQMSYTTGTIDVQVKVANQICVGGIVGLAHKISASNIASTMEIINLGSSISQTATCYAGNFAGILGYSGGNNTSVNDCFTAGAIKIDRENLRGAIGGFVGAMFGTVKNTYTATTITSISDDKAVEIACSENEKRYLSEDGIIGPMFGYSSTILQSSTTITAFYVFDYTGCVMRTVEADASRYGKQIAVSDIAKECIYGTNDPVMSVFAGSTTGSWKTLTYGDHLYPALNAYSLPILSFLESDTTLNSYCKFCETSTNTRINILSNPDESGVTKNAQAQEYQLYFGSKLYPYLLKHSSGYDLVRFRTAVEEDQIDVKNSYFALSADFTLEIPELVAFESINFNLLGYGNAINLISGRLFTNHLEEGSLIASVDFNSDYSIIGVNDGVIYNTIVSGSQNNQLVGGYISAFIKENNGLVVNSGVSATVTINAFSEDARYGLFTAHNGPKGIINSCFSTGRILLTAEAADGEGKVAGFISTVDEGSHIMNVISAVTINVIGLDQLDYQADIKAFVTTFESSEVVLSRIFVDKLSVGYDNAYDFEVIKGSKSQVSKNIYLVNTSYLVNYSDEGDKVSGDDTLGVMYGSKAYSDSDISLRYALAGRNYNYDYFMAYNYGYPFPSLIAYYEGRSIKNALFTGNGSELYPYQIPHAGKVDWIRKMLENTNETFFVLDSDIYMNVFNSFEPILSVKGDWFNIPDADFEKNTFDYQRNLCYTSDASIKPFTLSGLRNRTQYIMYYLRQDLTTDAGLFATLTNGQKVVDFAMTYADIRTTGAKSGAIAGTIKNNAKLENVGVFNSFIFVPSNVSGKADVGGMVGYAESIDLINKVSAEVKINMPANKNQVNIGGLIGNARNVMKLTYCYAGSNINILDNTNIHEINKTNIGGLVGYNFNDVNAGTTFDNCVILTSVNYSGLVGYKYNVSNYGKETLLDNDELNNPDKITAFANIGNVVGASHINEDNDLPDHITIKNTYFCDKITMITQTYAVGNNYGVDNGGLIIGQYSNCLNLLNGKKYCSIGAKIGSKINPMFIDGEEYKLSDFGSANEYSLFAVLTATHEVPQDGVDLSGKFLYGNGTTVNITGSMINTSYNCILSNIIVNGQATGETRGGSGLLTNYAENTLVYKCSCIGNVVSDANYVGGLVGYGEATVLNQCTSQAVISGNFAEGVIGSIAGEIRHGGVWFCKANNPKLEAEGNGSYVGGIVGHVSSDNSFIINCEINTGDIFASLTGGTAGGLVGHLDGLIIKGVVGTSSYSVRLKGYYAGGVAGSVTDDATNIFLNGFTVYVNIMDGSYVGGICSHFTGRGYVVKNSKVYGTINGTQATGGIAGYIEGSVSIGLNEENKNIVYATVGGGMDNNNIGGIVGTSANSKILYNLVEGLVQGKENVGGIAGCITSTNVSDNIVDKKTVKGAKNVGGIVGYVKEPLDDAGGNSASKIENNTCKVETSCTISEAGGIIGYVDQVNTQVVNNTSVAVVKGPNNIGGIVGASSLPETRENDNIIALKNNHKRKGNVESQGNAGGIIGYMASGVTNANILGEDAVIKVSGAVVGGIVGRMSVSIGRGEYSNETSNIVDDALSNRDHLIEGTEAAGGIVGYADCSGKITNVIVKAKNITSANGVAGGVVGYASKVDVNSIQEIKFTLVKAKTFAGGIIGQGSNAKVPQQSFKTTAFGDIKGKDAAVYCGNATKINLEGKEDSYITLSVGAPQASEKDGSIGAIFGYADSCLVQYVKSTINVVGGDSSALGGIIGMMNNSEVNYVEVTGSPQGSANSIGGIIGEITGTQRNNVTYTKFASNSLSSSGKNVGGIIGSSARATIENNSVTASLSIACNNGGNAGGIVGNLSYGSVKAENTVIMNVTNVNSSGGSSGGIVGKGSSITVSGYAIGITGITGRYAGGIVGEINNDANDSSVSEITFKNAFTINGTGDSALGGVIGKANGGYKKITVSDMNVPVTSVTGENTKGASGGIVGKAVNVTVSKCNIAADSIYIQGNNCGGIYGDASSSTVSASTVCTVNIKAGDNGGGIYGKGTDVNSFNYSTAPINVSIKGSNVGAVAGTLEGRCSLNKLKLTGSVTGESYTGGIIGKATNVSISDCSIGVTVKATKGVAYGSICGEANSCSITNMVVASGLSCSGVSNQGAAVGSQFAGSLSITVDSTFKFTGSGSNANIGAFVGTATGNVSVHTNGNLFKLTVNSSSGASVGGFVGSLLNGGQLSCPTSTTSVNISGGTVVGGICGTCTGASIKGGYTLYWKLSGGVTAGEHAAGDDRLLNTEATYYIHKYGGGSNNPTSYASAVVNQSGSATSFMGGSAWGSSLCLYPNEKLTFNDSIANTVILTNADGALTYMDSPPKSEVANLALSGPIYMKEINNNKIRLQCSVNECPDVVYYFKGWKHIWDGDNKPSGEVKSALNLVSENLPGGSSNNWEALATRVSGHEKWMFANGDVNSQDNYVRDYTQISLFDIASAMQNCYDINIGNNYGSFGALKSAIRSKMNFSNDITLEAMQKWTLFYNYTYIHYVDSVFDSNATLLYNINQGLGPTSYKAGEATDINRQYIQSTLNSRKSEYGSYDDSFIIDKTTGGMSYGGMRAWYRNEGYYDFTKTLDDLYKANPYTEKDDQWHDTKTLHTYHIKYRVYVDNFLWEGNPTFDLDIETELHAKYRYNVKAALPENPPAVIFQEEIVEVTDD